jgi:hypothetical protein
MKRRLIEILPARIRRHPRLAVIGALIVNEIVWAPVGIASWAAAWPHLAKVWGTI